MPEVDPAVPPVTQPGDLWQLGRHRLLCADAHKVEILERLMGGLLAEMVFRTRPTTSPSTGMFQGSGP